MKTYVYSFLSISGVARLILGVLFITGGVMHFTADATLHHSIFIDQLVATGYMWQFIGIVELISGILLLTPQYVVLGAHYRLRLIYLCFTFITMD
jgi:uncharacterized membrane protein YphA (DoxX/SURF4 family)